MPSGHNGRAGFAVSLIVHDGAVPYPTIGADSRLVVVVRDPATNSSHPNVVSVPTGRVPREYAAVLWPKTRATLFGDTHVTAWQCYDSQVDGRRNPVVHEVMSLLSQKLGLGDALEYGDVRFEAGVVAMRTGLETPGFDRLSMITVLVGITSGADQIPSRTASYSDIRWVPAGRFVEAVARRDPSELGLSPIELCIHGLCIASTYDVLASGLGQAPYRV
jgi:hypothetical protein